MLLEDNFKPVRSIRMILTEKRKRFEMVVNIVFYGSIALAVLSGIIKFIIK